MIDMRSSVSSLWAPPDGAAPDLIVQVEASHNNVVLVFRAVQSSSQLVSSAHSVLCSLWGVVLYC